MKTITLPSGTYAVDPILDGFDIIERPSSNVAFVGTDILAEKMYVQFKNGSGYMYSEVDADIMSAIPAALSIGSFISAYVVKKFPSEKQSWSLINEITKLEWIGDPVLVVTGDIKGIPNKTEPGILFVPGDATIEYIEPKDQIN